MTTNSPPSPFIFIPNVDRNLDLVLKTQPFYSIFYKTNNKTNRRMPERVKMAASNYRATNRTPNGKSCNEVLRNSVDPNYIVVNDIPFHLYGNENGKENLYFLFIVFMTTIVIGTITFSYWSYLLGDNIMEDNFRKTVGTRSIYLSVLFVIMMVFLSVVFYEFFTLKRLSLRWFQNYQTRNPTSFYDFLLNTRKIFLWGFMIIWLGIVLFITIAISKRPDNFVKLISINIVSILMLFASQYLYYRTPSKEIKTFCLILSTFVIGLVLFLMYGV